MRYVGVFAREDVAAAAWDIEALRLRGKAAAVNANFPHLLSAYEAALASGDDSVVAAYKVMGVAEGAGAGAGEGASAPLPRAPAAPRRGGGPAPARTRKAKRGYEEDEDESEDWMPGSHSRALSAPAGRPSASASAAAVPAPAFRLPPLSPPLPAPPSLGDAPMQGLGFGALMASSEEGGGGGSGGEGLGAGLGVHPAAAHLRASSSPPRLGDTWHGLGLAEIPSYEEMGGLGFQ